MTTGFDALRLLFGGYLNLDWIDDYGDAWDAVADFVELEPLARELPDEVSALLSRQLPEGELRSVLVDGLGSGYLPDADGWRYDEWLLELSSRVVEALGH